MKLQCGNSTKIKQKKAGRKVTARFISQGKYIDISYVYTSGFGPQKSNAREELRIQKGTSTAVFLKFL